MQKNCESGMLAKFNYWIAFLAGCLIVGMVIGISYDVGARYLFNSPTKWIYEFSEYCLLAVVYLSGAWTLSENGHVRVDVLYSHYSIKKQAAVEVFLCVLGIVFTIIFTWQGIMFVWDGIVTGSRSETYLEVLQWPIRLIMTVGTGLLCIAFMARLKSFSSKYKNLRDLEN
ncbi:MAG: TRAP transporter small permease [Anaerolineales bacterium]|nr:TRAP transporter small permease [Anaerolineales bacterium]